MSSKLPASVLAETVRQTPPGVWAWYLDKIDRNYLKRLHDANCRRVYLKVYDDKGAGVWPQAEHAAEFQSAGISVVGWGYHFDQTRSIDPAAEAGAVGEAVRRGLDGYIVDIEVEAESRATDDAVRELLVRLRDVLDGKFLGYSSFGHPGFHRDMPWRIFDENTDLAFPQIYFESWRGSSWAHSDDDAVKLCLQAHRDLGLTNPILPVWGCEAGTSHPASTADLQRFLRQFPGSSVYRLPTQREAQTVWGVDYAPPKPPDDAVPPEGLPPAAPGAAATPPDHQPSSFMAPPAFSLEQMTMVAMRISGSFEGDDPWANITGNFDEQGLTCGMLGKTFADGDQQNVIRRYRGQFGDAELLRLMPQSGRDYLRLCALPPAQGTAQIAAWSVGGNTEKVLSPYLEELRQFWKSPGMVGVQFAAALDNEAAAARQFASALGFEATLHSFCFFFDLAVQGGGLRVARSDLDAAAAGGLPSYALEICRRCDDADFSHSNWRDAQRNAGRWRDLLGGADAVALRLFAAGWLRSTLAKERYKFTVMNRRGTLAFGTGFVNGTAWNWRVELGLDPAADGVPVRPAVLVMEWLNHSAPDGTGEAGTLPAPTDVPAPARLLRVNASPALNLRSAPNQNDPANILARLPRGSTVRALGADAGGVWQRVCADLGGGTVEGHAAARYLTSLPVADGEASSSITSVDLSATARLDGPPDAHPLADSLAPRRRGATSADRCRELADIISYLDVAHSARYQAGVYTFCNIYAYDYCHLADAYLPRVWWTAQSIARLAQHETVVPVLDSTVEEMRANDLHEWFGQFGTRFGWRQVFTAGDLQAAADAGGVGVIVAHQRIETHAGHIVIVPPETPTHCAQRSASGSVAVPLQSQAGRVNFAYGMGRQGTPWWADQSNYKAFGFWTHA